MKLLTKKQQRELVNRIIANSIIAQDAVIKADLPVKDFVDVTEHLVKNTVSAVCIVNGQEGLDKLKMYFKI